MDERTPLLTTVRLRPVRRQRHHSICRRFLTIALSSILVATLISFFFTAFFDPDCRYGPGHPWLTSLRGNITEEQLKAMLIGTPSSRMAARWSKHYTSGPHLAGTNYSLAEWTREKWDEYGIKSDIVSYDVYVNYPVDHRLAMLGSEGVSYEASLAEDVLEEDPTSGLDDRIPTFHGYSANGNVTAPFVYVNYGTYQDYADLVNANVSLEGKIAVARYGGIFRGLKVKRAQELGMVGVVLFTDPGDDGEVTDENGYAQYPDGPARNPSSVQRGSAQFLSVAPGDPTTPGYPSKPGVPRQPTEHVIPQIPSIPISYRDALPILKALNGRGPKSSDFGHFWTENEGLRYKGVEYNVGPSPDDLVLNLYNKQEYVTTPLWNVVGVINGTIPDEVVVLGNHRDAWVAGGAGDPNSGSAVMMEVVRSFGEAVKAGWKPLRTIVFASWDGEEYALIGSTEWVEEYLPWLSGASVAYVNVDIGVAGPHFSAAAAPLLDNVLYSATREVLSPNQTVKGQTIADVWDGNIRTMGSGSDFTAFQDFAGIPCIDMGFRFDETSAVYHYHSNYDSFHWMDAYGDPGFKYHKAMAQLLGIVAATLVDRPLIPFNATTYADALDKYVDSIEDKLDAIENDVGIFDVPISSQEELAHVRGSTFDHHSHERNHHQRHHRSGDQKPEQSPGAGLSHSEDPSHPRGSKKATMSALRSALGNIHHDIAQLRIKTVELDYKAAYLSFKLREGKIPWWKFWEWIKLIIQVRKVNGRYKQLERNFLWEEGLDGRSWFKHVVFAPGLWTGYAGATFPGLVESIDELDYENALRWADIIMERINAAQRSIS